MVALRSPRIIFKKRCEAQCGSSRASISGRERFTRVTQSIIKFQREFFDKGIDYLRPLILKDVADDIEMHESTISRVTTNKYVHTPAWHFRTKIFL